MHLLIKKVSVFFVTVNGIAKVYVIGCSGCFFISQNFQIQYLEKVKTVQTLRGKIENRKILGTFMFLSSL